MSLSIEDLKVLRREFTGDTIGVKVQSFNKDRTRAMLVLYVSHTDVAARVEDVDPSFTFEIVSQEWRGDYCFVRGKLTIKGVSRENVGEGEDPKSAASDAFKRAAMSFGVSRYLYDSDQVWVPYDDQRDRFRTWTMEDVDQALGKSKAPTPKPAPTRAPSRGESKPGIIGIVPIAEPRTRDQLGAEIIKVQRALGMTDSDRDLWIREEYQTTAQKMTIDQMEKFLVQLQCELGAKGEIK